MKPPIAVLVDGDQLGPEGMPGLMERLAAKWTVTERYCVRNWRSTRDQQAWREFADEHSFRLIQRDPVATGKNASDIELAVIAMDLLHAGHRAFCLVSGDMDFTPLVARLRRGGCEVEWVRPSDLPARSPATRGRGSTQSSTRGRSITQSSAQGGRASRTAGPPSGTSSGGGRPAPEVPTTKRSRPARRRRGEGEAPAAQLPAQTEPPKARAQDRRGTPASAPQKPEAKAPPAKRAQPSVSSKPQTVDANAFARAVRRVIEDLRRAGEHERGWVSVNRLGSKLTEAGTTKEEFGFPKRRPLWAALEEAGLQIEQMETGQYRVTLP